MKRPEKCGESEFVEIYNQPNDCIFYHGNWIMDLQRPSLFTYNIVAPMQLTKDRTAKNPWLLHSHVTNSIMQQNNQEFIESILNMDEGTCFEGTLIYDSYGNEAGKTFLMMVEERKPNVPSRILSIYEWYRNNSVVI